MDFRGDERGQPVVVGALLVFAILVLAFAGYQAVVVPNQNADVEFSHSQQVQDDMVDLRVGIVRAAIGGSDTSTSVRLGTQYPSRLIALNPPPPAGTLRTTEAEDIVVLNNQGENVDLCADPGTTRSFVYRPNYNELREGPVVVYENTFAYSRFRNGDTVELVRTNQRLVDRDDRVIELIALEGEYSESGPHRVGVDFIRGETTSEVVNQPEITLPTQVVNEGTWEEDILGGEANIEEFQPGESVTFSLNERYEVRCTPVGINRAPESGSSDIARPTSDGGDETTSTSITAGNISDLESGRNDQIQTFEFDIDGVLAEGDEVTIDLRNANGNGVDYSSTGQSNPATVHQDAGTASISNNGNEITFTAGNGGHEGTVTVEVEGIDVDAGTSGDTFDISFTRQDTDETDVGQFTVT